jgi:hypothetical protein
MREALKKFTTFTNRFKFDQPYKQKLFKDASTRSIAVIDDMAQKVKWKPDPRIKGGKVFSPLLPEIERNDQKRWIKYTRDIEHIRTVSQFLFEKPDADPSAVGEACFDRAHREADKE